MNGGMIRFILGSVLKVESVLLLFPCIVAVFYRESAGYLVFAYSSAEFCDRLSDGKKETSQYGILSEGRLRDDCVVMDYDQSGRLSAILFVRRDSCIYRRVI